jgi:hypothetical protein
MRSSHKKARKATKSGGHSPIGFALRKTFFSLLFVHLGGNIRRRQHSFI